MDGFVVILQHIPHMFSFSLQFLLAGIKKIVVRDGKASQLSVPSCPTNHFVLYYLDSTTSALIVLLAATIASII